jgi:acyl-coenzyme A thioesterase PaaI-like protein
MAMKMSRFLNPLRVRHRQHLRWFPPYWLMGIKILETRDNWRYVRIKLPLTFFTRHGGGSMFGGTQSALADPIPAIACAHIFPGHSVWTRDLYLDFQYAGNTDLELRFTFDPEQEATIKKELESKGRSTPTFEFGFYRADGKLCTTVRNTVAIRPRGYKRQDTAY